jgi:hypothetical protein
VSISKNHAKAPVCSKFVSDFREVFGREELTIVRVQENDVAIENKEWLEQEEKLPEPATCFFVGSGTPIQEAYGDTSRAEPRAKNKTSRAR